MRICLMFSCAIVVYTILVRISCRRAAAAVCPALSPLPVGAEALCAAEQTVDL